MDIFGPPKYLPHLVNIVFERPLTTIHTTFRNIITYCFILYLAKCVFQPSVFCYCFMTTIIRNRYKFDIFWDLLDYKFNSRNLDYQRMKAHITCLPMYMGSKFRRACGFQNLLGTLVYGGHNLPHLVGIGLRWLPKLGGDQSP